MGILNRVRIVHGIVTELLLQSSRYSSCYYLTPGIQGTIQVLLHGVKTLL